MDYDVVVVGGGAAGLMCAQAAGRRGRRVRVLEHASRVGRKILMSGGGRCNFTNRHSSPANFRSANPHFCKSALARYTPQDFIGLVERHRIAYHEKELGQLFCDDSSKQIVQLLLAECAEAGVEIAVGCEVTRVAQAGGGFVLETQDLESGTQRRLSAQSLVIASGGLSIPKMGASGFGYELARQFGHAQVATRAGLVPFTLSGRPLEELQDLSGIAVPVEARCNGQSFRGPMLFTHRGLSGPAILQISSYWQSGDALHVDLLPDLDAFAWLQQLKEQRPAAELKTLLAEELPRRVAERWCELHFPSKPIRQYAAAELRGVAAQLKSWQPTVSGTEGYRTAEVTLGGVDTAELSSTTMESRRVPRLYFIGEVVDVTGHLGGHNFQWAWASGMAAGQAV
jgi:predicted Rossmann fold flavoprotein